MRGSLRIPTALDGTGSRVSAQVSPGTEAWVLSPFSMQGGWPQSQPCGSVSEPLPNFNSAVNVTTGPDSRQQSLRVPNAGTEAPAPHAYPAMDMGPVRFARGRQAVEEQRGATEAPALCVQHRGSKASPSGGNLRPPTVWHVHEQRAQSRLLASGPVFVRVPETERRHQHPTRTGPRASRIQVPSDSRSFPPISVFSRKLPWKYACRPKDGSVRHGKRNSAIKFFRCREPAVPADGPCSGRHVFPD